LQFWDDDARHAQGWPGVETDADREVGLGLNQGRSILVLITQNYDDGCSFGMMIDDARRAQGWPGVETDADREVGRSGPNLEIGTMRVYVTNGPRSGLNIGRKVDPCPGSRRRWVLGSVHALCFLKPLMPQTDTVPAFRFGPDLAHVIMSEILTNLPFEFFECRRLSLCVFIFILVCVFHYDSFIFFQFFDRGRSRINAPPLTFAISISSSSTIIMSEPVTNPPFEFFDCRISSVCVFICI